MGLTIGRAVRARCAADVPAGATSRARDGRYRFAAPPALQTATLAVPAAVKQARPFFLHDMSVPSAQWRAPGKPDTRPHSVDAAPLQRGDLWMLERTPGPARAGGARAQRSPHLYAWLAVVRPTAQASIRVGKMAAPLA